MIETVVKPIDNCIGPKLFIRIEEFDCRLQNIRIKNCMKQFCEICIYI